MRKVLRADEQGFFVEDIMITEDEDIPNDCIETECPGRLFKPKWSGSAWAESLGKNEVIIKQQQIDLAKETAIKNLVVRVRGGEITLD